MSKITIWGIAAVLLASPAATQAALPLITDDTGTQGKGRFQVEVGGEYDRDRETLDGVKETDVTLVSTLTYGAAGRVDLFMSVPYAWGASSQRDSRTMRVNGISDTSLGVKWRFLEQQGASLAFRPFLALPTGNDQKGTGAGKYVYGLLLIGSAEAGPWSFHANLGYTRNENNLGERRNLWQASMAGTYGITKDVTLCIDIGTFTNRDRTSEVEPSYVLGGVIYSIGEDLEVSFAVKHTLNDGERDWTVLPGITYRF